MHLDASRPLAAEPPPPPRPFVWLSGHMGVGKSTVARHVAAALGLPCVDLDAEIEARTGRTIAALFAADGEPAFRLQEAAALQAVLAGPPAVVALGGGAVLDGASRALLRSAGVLVTLEARPETLCARLAGDTARPLFRPDVADVAARLAARATAYADADARVPTDGRTPETVAGEVLSILTGRQARLAL